MVSPGEGYEHRTGHIYPEVREFVDTIKSLYRSEIFNFYNRRMDFSDSFEDEDPTQETDLLEDKYPSYVAEDYLEEHLIQNLAIGALRVRGGEAPGIPDGTIIIIKHSCWRDPPDSGRASQNISVLDVAMLIPQEGENNFVAETLNVEFHDPDDRGQGYNSLELGIYQATNVGRPYEPGRAGFLWDVKDGNGSNAFAGTASEALGVLRRMTNALHNAEYDPRTMAAVEQHYGRTDDPSTNSSSVWQPGSYDLGNVKFVLDNALQSLPEYLSQGISAVE